MKYPGFITGLLCFAALSSSAQLITSTDFNDLRYTFKKGDQFEVLQHSEQDSYLTIDGVQQRNTQQFDATLNLKILELQPGGAAAIEGHFSKLVLVSSGNNQRVSVDISSDGKDIYTEAFKAVTSRPFHFVLTEDGNVKDVTGIDSVLDSIVNTLSSLKKKEERDAMGQLLKSQFGSEELNAKLIMVLPHYPTHEVRIGDSWPSVIYTDGFYHGRIDNYWKLEYADKYTIKLSNQGRFTTDRSEVVDMGSGLKGTIDLTGNTHGDYLVDPETEWPSTCNQHTELNGSYTYKANKKLKMKDDLNVPVRVVSDISYHIKHL